MAKVQRDPSKVAKKWATRIKGASEEMRDGVNAVQQAPGQDAIKKKAKMVNNWQGAIESGKWEKNTGKVTVEEWRTKMLNKGIPRVAAGADAAQEKMVEFQGRLLAYINTGKAQLEKIDDSTPEGRQQRMVFWSEYMRRMPKG